MTQEIYNVLVIGKTGVGKSGFINYLFDKEVAKSDAGRPQTTEGFHEYTLKVQDLPPVNIFDSWGLEAGKHSEWMKHLHKELENRGTNEPANKWFHSVFYCIQAGGHRVEPADVQIINLLIEQQYPVTILLTKSDLINEEDEEKMQSTINKEFQGGVKAIPISIGASTRGGGKSEPFGKDKVLQLMKSNCYLGLLKRLPLHLRNILNEYLKQWENKASAIIKSVGYMDEDEILDKIKKLSEENFKFIPNKLKEEFSFTMKIYQNILTWTDSTSDTGPSNKYFSEKSDDLKWYELLLLFTPPVFLGVIAYGLIKGKEDNRKKLQKFFDKDYFELKNHCEKLITSFEDFLKKEATNFGVETSQPKMKNNLLPFYQ